MTLYPGATTFPGPDTFPYNPTLEEQCELIWQATQRREREESARRAEPPLMRIWDGDWNLYGVLEDVFSADFKWINNDSGMGQTEIPFEHYVAQWIYHVSDRMDQGFKRNVHITVDKDGARWSGRLQDHSVEKRSDGTTVLVVRWKHDYETLKYYLVWSNPFLPDFIQFPRVFLAAGPSIWALKLALFLNVMREQTSLWQLPDDPLDHVGWDDELDMSNWSVVVKPTSFAEDMANGTLWTVIGSRWKYWHDMAKLTLEDAELTVVVRRFIESDDEQPIPGQTLRNGTLVVDIVDKSGYYTETSNGGDLYAGLRRTVAKFTSDFIDSTEDLIEDATIPGEYMKQNYLSTNKKMPYVVYQEGEETGIETSKFTFSPATAVQIGVGGHSMPMVNELMSATIQAVGDILGNLCQIGSIGGSIDTLLKPLYVDTILAWMSVKSVARAQNSGWSHYFEYFQDGADRAYTLSSLLVLRAGFYSTKSWFSHELQVRDASPWLVGDNGQGHFFLGDRIGATVKGDFTGRIYIDRVTELSLAWDRETFPEWVPVIGDGQAMKDPGQRALDFIESIKSLVHDLGLF